MKKNIKFPFSTKPMTNWFKGVPTQKGISLFLFGLVVGVYGTRIATFYLG